MPSDTQVIYSMVRVGRIDPPNKQVLGEDRDLLMNYDRDEEGKENEQGSNKNSEDKGDDHETKSSNI